MKILILLTALAVLSGCAVRIHDGNRVIYDEGGRVDVYERRAQASKCIAGTAISAATFYLKNGAVEPDAVLVFHPPQFDSIQPPAVHQYWAKRIAQNYPPKIAAWYLGNYAKTRTKSGAWAIEMGAREC